MVRLFSKYVSPHRKEYHSQRKIQITVTLILAIVLILLEVYSLSVNSFKVTMGEAWNTVLNRIYGIEPVTYIDRMIDYVVIEVNAPRAIAAIMIGTILAISGAVMQTLTHNPLSEPYTIGISSAAMFGVTISIAMGISIVPGLDRDTSCGINAFVFALIPAIVILLATTARKLSPNMMILIGIGMMYVFTSITTLIKFNANEEDLHEIYIWGLGTLSKIDWGDILPLTIAALFVFIGFTYLARVMNVLTAGDNVCQSLGVNPFRVRVISFVMVSLGVAVAVCYSGTIGFVGLVAPHITRLFTGNNNRLLIPVSAMAGALLIIMGDIIVRLIPGGLPAGVITALIGSPLFLYFLFRQRRNATF